MGRCIGVAAVEICTDLSPTFGAGAVKSMPPPFLWGTIHVLTIFPGHTAHVIATVRAIKEVTAVVGGCSVHDRGGCGVRDRPWDVIDCDGGDTEPLSSVAGQHMMISANLTAQQSSGGRGRTHN